MNTREELLASQQNARIRQSVVIGQPEIEERIRERAQMVRAYFEALVEVGFTTEQALMLTASGNL